MSRCGCAPLVSVPEVQSEVQSEVQELPRAMGAGAQDQYADDADERTNVTLAVTADDEIDMASRVSADDQGRRGGDHLLLGDTACVPARDRVKIVIDPP